MKKSHVFKFVCVLSVVSFMFLQSCNKEKIEWPTQTVNQWIETLVPECGETIPPYTECESITIDTQYYQLDNYIGIYCKTNNSNSENKYKTILEKANWNVSSSKENNYYQAYSPKNLLWVNFAFDSAYSELQIYLTAAPFTSFPEERISFFVNKLGENITDKIVSFDAQLFVVNYYPQLERVAINGYGVESSIVNEYKTAVEDADWQVKSSGNAGDYIAISPNKQLEINFYYDDSKTEFNVDVALYVDLGDNWPTADIAKLINDMGATGTVEPYCFENNGFRIDTAYTPWAIMVSVDSVQKAKDGAAAYNQMLLDKGYSLSTSFYGEPSYAMAGTTLAYRACQLNGAVVTIELFTLSEPQK